MKKYIRIIIAQIFFLFFAVTVIWFYNSKLAVETPIETTLQKSIEVYPITVQAELTKIAEVDITPIPTSSISSENWLSRWLNSPTCQPPCWENITPGETSFNYAVRMIASIPGVNIEGIFLTPSLLDNTTRLNWNFGLNGSGGSLSSDYDNQIVKYIELFPENNQILLIENLISSYGNPDSAITSNCFGEFFTMSCSYLLIYKNSGMVIHLTGHTEDIDSINIYPDTKVLFVSLSPKDNIKLFENPNAEIYEIAWDGYKVYKFK